MARVNQTLTVVVATDLVITATNTQVTSSTHPFVVGDIGKYIVVTAGTNFTPGAYKITGIPSGVIAQVNAAVGTAGATGGTFSIPQRLASTQTLGDRLFIQMKTNGSGLGYVLYSDSGAIPPSKANDADVVAELALATSTAPGGTYSDVQPGGGNFMDMSAYWVDGAVNGDKIRASYNVR